MSGKYSRSNFKQKKKSSNQGFLFLSMRKRRLELPRRLTHAPQTCLSTYSSTLAYLADALTPFKAVRITRRATSKAWRIIADYLDLSRVNFDFLKFFLFGAV